MPNTLHISLNVRRETKDRLLKLQRTLSMLDDDKVLLNDAVEFAIEAAEQSLIDRKAAALAELYGA